MKTVLIYDQCGQDNLKFLVAEGDLSKFDGVYINNMHNADGIDDELNAVIFTPEWELVDGFTDVFPVEAVREGAQVVVCGFLP